MTSDREDFVAAMRRFPAAVNLVATGAGEARAGLTATAVMSLTAEPPQVAVCVNRSTSAFPALRANGRFCVNTLASHHDELAARFSGPVKGAERFATGRWADSPCGPVLEEALVTLECEIAQEVELSTHVLFVCDVVRTRRSTELNPLLYVSGDWASLLPASRSNQADFMTAVQVSIEAIDRARAASEDRVNQLDAVAREITQVYIDQQKVTRDYLTAELYVSPERVAELNAAKRIFDEKLTRLLEEGRREGRFQIEDARLTALAIAGMVGWLHRWYRPGGRLGEQEVAALMSRLIQRMVGAQVAGQGAAPDPGSTSSG